MVYGNLEFHIHGNAWINVDVSKAMIIVMRKGQGKDHNNIILSDDYRFVLVFLIAIDLHFKCIICTVHYSLLSVALHVSLISVFLIFSMHTQEKSGRVVSKIMCMT